MKTNKKLFLVIVFNLIVTMSLSAQVTDIYLDKIPNQTCLYYCAADVDSVIVHSCQWGSMFILSGMGSVVFTDNITINQQNQGAVSCGNAMINKQLYIYFLSSEEWEKMN